MRLIFAATLVLGASVSAASACDQCGYGHCSGCAPTTTYYQPDIYQRVSYQPVTTYRPVYEPVPTCQPVHACHRPNHCDGCSASCQAPYCQAPSCQMPVCQTTYRPVLVPETSYEQTTTFQPVRECYRTLLYPDDANSVSCRTTYRPVTTLRPVTTYRQSFEPVTVYRPVVSTGWVASTW